jgi:hypothetical protein
MFCGVVTMVDAGLVVLELVAVLSLFVSFVVVCSLLLQEANENNKPANSEIERIRGEIIVVVLKIKKWGSGEVMQGIVGLKFTISQ